MKKLIFAILLLALVCTSVSTFAQQSEGSKIISEFKYKDIKWSVPQVGKEVKREVLDNGIILYMMEDHSLPLLSMSAKIRCGEAYESTEMMAVPDFTGSIMRSGGTTNVTADSLNAILELVGGSVETWIGSENGGARLSVLTKDTELGVRLMADVLRNPAFPEDKIDLMKSQYKNRIKRRNDRPASILSREFYHVIYGDHPDGRILEWAYIKDISRDDLVAYHEKYFAPNNLMIGITGDFKPKEIKKLLNQYFGDWKQKGITFPKIQKVKNEPKPGVYQLQKDINQANIRFGHLGITRDNPDRFAISIMNYILGGGSFTSRMTTKVRSDEGLAYSVRSSFNTGSRDLGTFNASTQTKSSTAYKALRLMMDEVERIRKAPVEDEELDGAKDSYINRYVFGFTSAGQIVGRLMGLEFNDRPRDLLQKYLDNIHAVTKEDVLRVAKKYLTPENLTIMVVGNADNFDKPFDEFGAITHIEITDPVLE
ncbi:MAG: insulinase family protein [candidate division Zixibacteria bacterium]|nr:insulinase family protein [candidate division Zixibacteria bacterium]